MPVTNFHSRALDKFVVRLPDGMREQLGVAARKNNRTMNAEIVSRLEQSFADPKKALLILYENSTEAEIVWELKDAMTGLRDEVADLKASLMKPGKKG